MSTETPQRSFTNSLLSGGMAGFTVDVLLFPLDTVKTRLQVSGDLLIALHSRLRGFIG